MKEVFETYTDTWDKIVKVEVLKRYTNNEKTIFTMHPDFEDIELIETPTKTEGEDEERYTEIYHLKDIGSNIISIYNKIKQAMLTIDSNISINPQKYYISLREKRNFAYLKPRKTRMNIVIMTPIETGQKIIKYHTISQLGQGVQDFYNGPCYRVTIKEPTNLEEIIQAIDQAHKLQ